MKYENFSAKKLQNCVFFCNFVPDLVKNSPQNESFNVQFTRI